MSPENAVISCLRKPPARRFVFSSTAESFHRWSVEEYLRGYKSGKFSPVDVAKAIIDAVKRSDSAEPPLRSVIQMNETMILEDAKAAEMRIKSGKMLSALDGVPILFKEEIDVAGYFH
eukprot:TRINITY_DN2587_c0_g2_i1.p2 TRINITY_DN2587_c0_g2~~TRINITY_DN2587_c0_g2_i1.p2  ORF type:complete len:118 (-),score=16.45 TRINITY_DN2587_c0_g2_i1:440-793(-)